MNSLEDSKFTICKDCNKYKLLSYPSRHCRKQCLLLSQQINNNTKERSIKQINQKNFVTDKLENELISGDTKLDEFIKETQFNSEYCDDFIEWVPSKNLVNVKFLANGGNSKVYFGTWSNMFLTTNIALKAITNSDNINESILNEFKMHHKCRSQNVIPFYGITKSPKGNDYAMVIGHAEHGDLRNYIRKFFSKLTWVDKINILIELSKALNSLHQMNLVHRDFHCKNILVNIDDKIFISDFGLCQRIDSETGLNSLQGVLPYIAPEVLRYNPYTTQSEVYSISMIMWELTSKKPPFSDNKHDIELALSILDGLRPEIIEGTPDFYADIMKQCWDSDPLKRPDASLLPKLFEEMLELCKMVDEISSNIVLVSKETKYKANRGFAACFSESKEEKSDNSVIDSKGNTTESESYETKAFEYTLSSIEDSIEDSSITIEGSIFANRKSFKAKSRKKKITGYYHDVMTYLKGFGSSIKKKPDKIDDLTKKQDEQDENNLLLKRKDYDNQIEDTYFDDYQEDSRYITQTYNFTLDDLNKNYNNRNDE